MQQEYTNMLGRDQALDDANYSQYLNWQNYGAQRIGLMNNALASIQGGVANSSKTEPNPNYTSAAQNTAAYATILASLYNGGG